jgi:23S rRNA pseudouridine2605 synthase
VYDLLPSEYHHLNPVGRLDKDSSGLLLLTNDGQLAYELTHPKFEKTKVYQVALDKPLTDSDRQHITAGIDLEDGLSRLKLEKQASSTEWLVKMSEGRNRQIRRTFAAAGYTVKKLNRIRFGDYDLGGLPQGKTLLIS